MGFLKVIVFLGIICIGAIYVMRLIFPLPSLEDRTDTSYIPPSDRTTLGAALLPGTSAHPGQSGVWPLADGREAYAARILLARSAEESIDLQYYIWQADATGWILLDEVRQAAERGVRVRMLLDDNGIPGLDAELSALNKMPNIEIRLFNPFTLRSPRLLSYAFDFNRLNHRMHNKSMTVDGIATIVGGRNIGNIYFDYGAGVHYFDADVLAVGKAAGEVSGQFDAYWSSGSSYPAERILADAPGGLGSLAARTKTAWEGAIGTEYADAVAATELVKRMQAGTLRFEWSDVTLFYDHPAKGLGEADEDDLLLTRIIEISKPERSFDLVSAYFIPGKNGTEILNDFAARGVQTRALTNALSATDVPPVHSAYIRYRGDLVDGGVDVLELRRMAMRERDLNLSEMIVGSASSLHAKTFAIDGKKIFVGSFNFDPRSARLNTEMGLLIERPDMARGLARVLDDATQFYRVRRDEKGDLIWIETDRDGSEKVLSGEPESTMFQRMVVRFVSWLPVEWML